MGEHCQGINKMKKYNFILERNQIGFKKELIPGNKITDSYYWSTIEKRPIKNSIVYYSTDFNNKEKLLNQRACINFRWGDKNIYDLKFGPFRLDK